jgi:hypothetical protein
MTSRALARAATAMDAHSQALGAAMAEMRCSAGVTRPQRLGGELYDRG